MSAPVQKSALVPREDDCPHGVVGIGPLQERPQRVAALEVDGVAAGRAVERQHCHCTGRLEAHTLDCHRI